MKRGIVGLALSGLLAVTALGGTAHAAESKSAARSVSVYLTNDTDCDWTLTSQSIPHGEWTVHPPSKILKNTKNNHMRTESNGIATGTEARVTYRTYNCKTKSADDKQIAFHWDNPYSGTNSYDFIGTNRAFGTNYSGGSGDVATVYPKVWIQPTH
ncbi:aegerolysin family protein [Kitasatospora sp. SUK 42]|uniref:aegerolysin family protein n=1 Tax=Kitasatospora sp. SUK 42 TaxID=1588882 RepID=UPI0018CAF63C|nr:aegerolysin family protein [Kitasatospora sp. SUK 42]MBV2156379.1 aegerolysin family protein [Kitasatospora sp. SUK 42]